jgi:hypothetical protein
MEYYQPHSENWRSTAERRKRGVQGQGSTRSQQPTGSAQRAVQRPCHGRGRGACGACAEPNAQGAIGTRGVADGGRCCDDAAYREVVPGVREAARRPFPSHGRVRARAQPHRHIQLARPGPPPPPCLPHALPPISPAQTRESDGREGGSGWLKRWRSNARASSNWRRMDTRCTSVGSRI